jgi:hypothetical protein
MGMHAIFLKLAVEEGDLILKNCAARYVRIA